MEKIILLSIILFLTAFPSLAFSQASPESPICCFAPNTEQKRCYTTGVCCAGVWDPDSCWNFEFTASGPGVFPVGQRTFVTLAIKNLGTFVDSYDITYSVDSATPNLVIVDMNGTTTETDSSALVGGVSAGGVATTNPAITVLANTVAGTVTFTATSAGPDGIQKSASITITESELPVSLPEFENVFVSALVSFSVLIYLIAKKDETNVKKIFR